MYYLCNMEWLNSLFFEHTPLQAVVILSIIIAVGLGLGKIHLFGISLGVTFVFFAGILAGHLGFSIDPITPRVSVLCFLYTNWACR